MIYVYAWIEGKLANWGVDTASHEEAIATVKEETGHKGPVLALILGESKNAQ